MKGAGGSWEEGDAPQAPRIWVLKSVSSREPCSTWIRRGFPGAVSISVLPELFWQEGGSFSLEVSRLLGMGGRGMLWRRTAFSQCQARLLMSNQKQSFEFVFPSLKSGLRRMFFPFFFFSSPPSSPQIPSFQPLSQTRPWQLRQAAAMGACAVLPPAEIWPKLFTFPPEGCSLNTE